MAITRLYNSHNSGFNQPVEIHHPKSFINQDIIHIKCIQQLKSCRLYDPWSLVPTKLVFVISSWRCWQMLEICASNLHCWSRDTAVGSPSNCRSSEHRVDAFWLFPQDSVISWIALQFWPSRGNIWCGIGGTRNGCSRSWGILHLWFRSHARHFFMISRSQGLETGAYFISWLGSVITLNLAQNVLYSEKGVRP